MDDETETRIVEKVEYIEGALTVLSRKQSLEEAKYLADREQRAIVEREFQTVTGRHYGHPADCTLRRRNQRRRHRRRGDGPDRNGPQHRRERESDRDGRPNRRRRRRDDRHERRGDHLRRGADGDRRLGRDSDHRPMSDSNRTTMTEDTTNDTTDAGEQTDSQTDQIIYICLAKQIYSSVESLLSGKSSCGNSALV